MREEEELKDGKQKKEKEVVEEKIEQEENMEVLCRKCKRKSCRRRRIAEGKEQRWRRNRE